jgi:chromosome segregation ATPase
LFNAFNEQIRDLQLKLKQLAHEDDEKEKRIQGLTKELHQLKVELRQKDEKGQSSASGNPKSKSCTIL